MEKIKIWTNEVRVQQDLANCNNVAEQCNRAFATMKKYGIADSVKCKEDFYNLTNNPERAEREYYKVQGAKLKDYPEALKEQARQEIETVWSDIVLPDISSCTIDIEFVLFNGNEFVVDENAIIDKNSKFLNTQEEADLYNELQGICDRLTALNKIEPQGQNIVRSGISNDTHRAVYYINKFADFETLAKK